MLLDLQGLLTLRYEYLMMTFLRTPLFSLSKSGSSLFFPGCLCFPSKNTPSMIRMISLGRVELGKPLSSSTAYCIGYLEDFFESRVSSNKNSEFPKIHQKSAYGKTSTAFHGCRQDEDEETAEDAL